VPRYVDAIRRNSLPLNVTVREFCLRPGAYLGNPYVQQQYANINYSQVAGELKHMGVNVLAQLVAVCPERPGRYWLGANPEVTLDLVPYFEERHEQCRQAGCATRILTPTAGIGCNPCDRNTPWLMARDVQDARVPRRPWMAESGPGEIDSDRPRAIFTPAGRLRRLKR